MYAILNRLPLKPDANWTAFARKVSEFDVHVASLSKDYRGLTLIRTGEDEATMVVIFESREGLESISRDIAGPWFGANIRDFLAGPASRIIGEVLAGSLGATKL